MTANASEDYRRWWVLTLANTNALYGAAYVVGGPATAPTLQLMERIAPMRLWGAALIVVGLLFIVRQHLYAGFIGAGIWAMFTYTSAITLLTGTSSAAGGVFLVGGVTALHLLISWGVLAGYSDTER